ncbi:AraC family transcriptional regulator [Neobacillus sp. YX16]|uniref:AraC family transcriptional regulator n=1 Tax=Neobacillus sp. YX16 TaxID=3047874 RepID=UPI0024C3D8AE|nr:AraC family transcriptional regulator [Neobacillus sp. YX16]WHZ03945.1 AraC family transcriptional regulator [Neobacillus sp. YX16]
MLDIKGVYHDVDPKWNIGKSRGCDTIVFVTEGKLYYWINDQKFEVQKGEVLHIPFCLDRAWKSHPDNSHQKYTAVFSRASNETYLPFAKPNKITRMKLRNAAYYEQRFAFLFIQWLGKRPYYEQMSQFILFELLTLIAQELAEWKSSPAKEQIARKIQGYILQNFTKNLTIEELSELVGYSPNYVTVVFKEVIGSTPIQYLHQIRINTAVNLLENTEMTVGEMSEYLGYCDQAYFNRTFKKWMGVAPTKLRL